MVSRNQNVSQWIEAEIFWVRWCLPWALRMCLSFCAWLNNLYDKWNRWILNICLKAYIPHWLTSWNKFHIWMCRSNALQPCDTLNWIWPKNAYHTSHNRISDLPVNQWHDFCSDFLSKTSILSKRRKRSNYLRRKEKIIFSGQNFQIEISEIENRSSHTSIVLDYCGKQCAL